LKAGEIFLGSIPYWIALLLAILALLLIPEFATWLPNLGSKVGG